MKTIRTTRAITALLALGTLSVWGANVWATSIIDDAVDGTESYWGFNDNGWGDVIGNADKFDILKAEVDYDHSAGSLRVDIHTLL